MNKTITAFIASLILAVMLISGYAYAAQFSAYVYPPYRSGVYVCGYDAWGYPRYCRSYGYPYYGYRWRHHHHHWPWRW
jgi:hypothetical protein